MCAYSVLDCTRLVNIAVAARNVLVEESDSHSPPPIAAGSELSELMLAESNAPTSFFSLLPRDLLNSVPENKPFYLVLMR